MVSGEYPEMILFILLNSSTWQPNPTEWILENPEIPFTTRGQAKWEHLSLSTTSREIAKVLQTPVRISPTNIDLQQP